MLTPWVCLIAVILDQQLGEPPQFHPLVGFGKAVQEVEAAFYGDPAWIPEERRARGVFAVLFLITPFPFLIWLLEDVPILGICLQIGLLYLAIGAHSLAAHAHTVADALSAGDLPLARERVGRIVSRDTQDLDEAGVSLATIESVLENGCDAIFGALFWFVCAGAAGAVVYRLANTLDAMWGYRTARYLNFGWAAARLDDLLNWVPARLTALSYTLCAVDPARAWRCWHAQAGGWKSPNAGPVMAAGAGALGVALGGQARYHGQWQIRPPLGEGPAPRADDIRRAVALVQKALWLWVVVITAGGLMVA